MAEIIDIKPHEKQKDKVTVFTEDGFFVINKETCLLERLSKGMILTQEKKDYLLFESDKKTAFLKGLSYIARKKCTKKMIEDYLLKKEFNEKAVQYAITKLTEYRYIDDSEYCKAYIQSSKGKGRLKIAYELKNRGIDENIISEYNKSEESELSDCILSAIKFTKNKDLTELKFKQKLYRHLLSKGYAYETVQNAINSIVNNSEDY